MKLKNLKMWIVTLIVATTIMVSCKKETFKNQEVNTENSQDITLLEETADNIFMNSLVQGGDESVDFYFENDGMPTEYSIGSEEIETFSNSEISAKRDFAPSQIIACLRKVNPNDEQVIGLRRALHTYELCKESVIKRYRASLAEIVQKHNAALAELKEALRNERITKEQFEMKAKSYRESLNASKNELAIRARKAVKECYSQFLRKIQSILNERQWKAFVGCLRR